MKHLTEINYSLFMDTITRYGHNALDELLKNKFEGKIEHPN